MEMIRSTHEARQILTENALSEADINRAFRYRQALEYLIEKTGDAEYIFLLGNFFYEQREFETAYKYITEATEKGSLNAAVLLADMYRNGYYVRKDCSRYRTMIPRLYRRVKNGDPLNTPLAEVFLRYAEICAERGEFIRALGLMQSARSALEQRMRNAPIFGTLNQIHHMIDELYSMTDFDSKNFELYDLFYILERNVSIQFIYNGKYHTVETLPGRIGGSVIYDGIKYGSADEFLFSATADGKKLTAVYDELYGFEIIGMAS